MNKKDDFFRIFREINGQFSRLYSHLLSGMDLSLQQYSLLNLLSLRGPTSMTEASQMLSITKPAVTNLADHLEKEKLIIRTPHPGDRRSYLLEIKPKGSKCVDHVQDVIFEMLSRTFEHFNPKEKEVVHNFYEKLAGHLTAQAQQRMGEVHE